MAKIHFLNVGSGDCTIIEHDSGRVTVIDICGGNPPPNPLAGLFPPGQQSGIEGLLPQAQQRHRQSRLGLIGELLLEAQNSGNGACETTNPINYLSNKINATSIFRFILTHPDMDHMDGFKNVFERFVVEHFWDSGVRKTKPEFSGYRFSEQDWNYYEQVFNGQTTTASVYCTAGDRFKYANRGDQDFGLGDNLYILAPSKELVDCANKSQDFNDASYVLLFRCGLSKIVIAGDAHDATWEYVVDNYGHEISDCDFLLAPHHGRKSGRSYDFLEVLRPKLTLFGRTPSQHLSYDAWRNRGLRYLTQSKTGNLVLESDSAGLNVYIENVEYCWKSGGVPFIENAQGYGYLEHINAPPNPLLALFRQHRQLFG